MFNFNTMLTLSWKLVNNQDALKYGYRIIDFQRH